ncbi:YwpF-like family protein [Virgibacillus siamensis]|uniref:YwpF-like family protein n=1 Tax=Virgibacillus siamensis TaxID=480071 RepID=UPI00098708B7|nr:YwpF-like family protein [Virgibacillus siamensis]
MKTFKLNSLDILQSKESEISQYGIELKDGLIINREDDLNQWIIEAYIRHEYLEYFKELQQERDEVMVQVKITKPENQPATFITSIIGVNEIGPNINVLFKGTMVDRKKDKVWDMLKLLVEQGYQGEELLDEFKEQLKNE